MLIIIKLAFDFYRKGADKLIHNVIKGRKIDLCDF